MHKITKSTIGEEPMRRNRGKRVINAVVIVIMLIVMQTLPVFFVAPLGNKKISGEVVRVHYQDADAQGASEVFNLLERECASLRASMKADTTGLTDVYIYHTQRQLAIREAGIITIAIAPEWYIGDSHNGNVMLVSPYTPVEVHTHETILQAARHEYVHALVHQVNPELSYFWDNGLATYLAKQKPEDDEIAAMPVPSIEDMHTENGLKFGNMGGYAFSYNYIEYLDQTYNWDKVMEYASGKGSYEEIFNESEEEIYGDWCQILKRSKTQEH